MSTTISFVDAQLNESMPFEPMIMIENNSGVLLVDKELFSISFNSKEEMNKMKVKVTNKI